LDQVVHGGVSNNRGGHLSVKMSGGADVEQTDSVSEFRQVGVDGQCGGGDVHVGRAHDESITKRRSSDRCGDAMFADVYIRRKFIDGEPVNRGGSRSRDAESRVQFAVYKAACDRVGGSRVERDEGLKGLKSAVTSSGVSIVGISPAVVSCARKVESTARGKVESAARGKIERAVRGEVSLAVGTC